MKVRLTKLSEAENPLHPNNIIIGYVKEGNFYKEPTEGEPFWVSNFATSTVQEILGPNTFRTHNSIYKWELISDEDMKEIKMRKSGRTTRIVDAAIQEFFEKGYVVTKDHLFPGTRKLGKIVCDQIRRRLAIEHRLEPPYNVLAGGVIVIAKDKLELDRVVKEYNLSKYDEAGY